MLMETIVVAKMSNKNLCVFKLFRPELFVAPDGDADKIGGDDDDGIDGIVGDQIVDKRNVRADNIFIVKSIVFFWFFLHLFFYVLNRKKFSFYDTLCLRAIVFYGVW